MLSRTKKNYTWFWCSGLHSADQLKPVHTGDYSPDFGDNLSPKTATVTEKKSATVAEFGRFLRQSPFSATVALFRDSVVRALMNSTCTW